MWTCKRCGKPVYFGEQIFSKIAFKNVFKVIDLKKMMNFIIIHEFIFSLLNLIENLNLTTSKNI